MQDMQTRRRRLAVLATLALGAALFSGCSWKSSGCTGSLPDTATLVKQSAAVTKNVTSAHLVLTVTGKIIGLPVKTLTGDLTTTPTTAAQGSASLTVFGSDIDAKFVVVDGDLYTNALNPGDPTMTNVGPAAQLYDPSAILSPDTGVANLLANFTPADGQTAKC
jgi:lipoprotein LprG